MKPWFSGYSEHALRYYVWFNAREAAAHKTKAEERLYEAAQKAVNPYSAEDQEIIFSIYGTRGDTNEIIRGTLGKAPREIWSMLRAVERATAVNGGLIEN